MELLMSEVYLPLVLPIGFDLEADAKRFRVTDSGVVIVTRTMLGVKPGLDVHNLNPGGLKRKI